MIQYPAADHMEWKDIPAMYTQYKRKGLLYTTEIKANYVYWKYINPYGIISGFTLENIPHPMDHVNLLSRVEVPEKLRTISFDFSLDPSSLAVRYWPDRYAGIREAYEIMYENVKVNGNSIHIPKEEHGYIFQVCAMWPQGKANYEFYLIPCIRFSPALK